MAWGRRPGEVRVSWAPAVAFGAAGAAVLLLAMLPDGPLSIGAAGPVVYVVAPAATALAAFLHGAPDPPVAHVAAVGAAALVSTLVGASVAVSFAFGQSLGAAFPLLVYLLETLSLVGVSAVAARRVWLVVLGPPLCAASAWLAAVVA